MLKGYKERMKQEVIFVKKIGLPIYLLLKNVFFLIKRRIIHKETCLECRKILRTINKIKPLSRKQIRSIKQYYKENYRAKVSVDWHQLYVNANDHFDVRYIPVDILFTHIIPFLNKKELREAYADKSRYEVLFSHIAHPATIIKKVDGCYYKDERIVSVDEAVSIFPKKGIFIIKPTIGTSQGDGVELLDCNKKFTKEQILLKFSELGDNFIIQEKIQSHPIIDSLNPSSLNTLRIITYRKENQVSILSVTLKIGKKGKFVDNGHQGGYFCGVTEDGKLKKHIYTFYPHFSKGEETESGIRIEGIQLPNYEQLKATVKQCALDLPYTRYAGWDIAIDREGKPVLVEVNLNCPGGNIMQIPNGPLFGDLTDEILHEVFCEVHH